MTNPKGSSGFTLVEILVALGIVTAILLPTSLWLYKSKVNRSALEKFQATQALELQMNRAFLTRLDKDWKSGRNTIENYELEIKVENSENEVRLLGSAINRNGKVICHLEADLFSGKLP